MLIASACLSRPRTSKPAATKWAVRRCQFLARLVLVFAAAWLCLGVGAATAQPKSGYTLGHGDKVQVTVFGRPDLSGEFRVRRSGTLSLPLIGEFSIAGLELSEIEDLVVERLKRISLSDQHVTVEVLEYRPFYILGDVTTPGTYPYVDGLTVLQAIAIAGGIVRLEDRDLQHQLAAMQAREELDVLIGNYRAAVARKARLIAERDGLAEISFPATLIREKDNSNVAELMDGERRLFNARRDALADTIALLERRKADAQEEMTALTAQVKSKKIQAGLVASELEDVQGLVDKGLAPKTRLLNLQSTAASIEGEVLEIRASIAQAKQDAARDELTILSERNEFREKVIAELQDVRSQIVEAEARFISLAQVLQLNASALISGEQRVNTADQDIKAVITRETSGGVKDFDATQYTTVLPGDTIRIEASIGIPTALPSIGPQHELGQRQLGSWNRLGEIPSRWLGDVAGTSAQDGFSRQ